jgi:phosphatidylglycerol:prolipoprotein diacylglycerol transferase
MLLSAFLFFYGLFRFILEFFRQPDVQKGFVIGPFSMGQVLCFMMMALGIYVFFYARSRKEVENPVSEKQTAVKRSKPKNKKAKP